ncbi:selenium-dependent molybdenum cofactor biosynthesis protein YqeB [Chloroflexota bacterium]
MGKQAMVLNDLQVVIKGGGEVASAIAHRLHRAHFRVLMTETAAPLAISRGVAFCEAIYDGGKEIDGVICKRAHSAEEIPLIWAQNKLAIMVDPQARVMDTLRPDVLVDAIMAKKNLATKIGDAPLVIGLGPGFEVGRDAHLIIETNNSEDLGRVILKGQAEADSRIPLATGGLTHERVLHAPADGQLRLEKQLGDPVRTDEAVAFVGEHPVIARIGGTVRALLRDGTALKKGTKMGEIDPLARSEVAYAIRPRMRAISGGVLEAILMRFNA